MFVFRYNFGGRIQNGVLYKINMTIWHFYLKLQLCVLSWSFTYEYESSVVIPMPDRTRKNILELLFIKKFRLSDEICVRSENGSQIFLIQ